MKLLHLDMQIRTSYLVLRFEVLSTWLWSYWFLGSDAV